MQRAKFSTRPLANPDSVVGGTTSTPYRFTVLTEGLIRYEYADDCTFEDRASCFAINRDLPKPDYRVINNEANLEIITDRFHLRYDKKPFSKNGLRVQVKGHNLTDYLSLWRYGGGQQEELYFLGGTARTLDNANGRIPLGPAAIARNGYSAIDDSSSMLFAEDGWVDGRRSGNRVDGYLFTYGLDYKEAMKAFFALSGKQPLIPRWSLGNWWSRYYKYTDREYLDLMDRFRSENLPFSVAVLDMDWHLVDNPVVQEHGFSGWTGYTWEPKYFPEPKKFLDQLHSRGLKACPNDHPADGVAPYEQQYEAAAKSMGLDISKHRDPIPFDITNKKYADAYFDIVLKPLEEDGYDFFWVDWQQGPFSSIPGVDPLWVLNHLHFLNNTRDNKRPITFSRFAGPGSHRYPVGFSGDTIVSWDSLDFQPEFTASASNIGYGWWSHDIGGHMGGYRDDDLSTRWVQLAVFSPLLRLHSSNNVWNSKEPWRFVPEARNAQNGALRLRHQLIPYIYSMNVRSARDDEPLVQPLYWMYPARNEAYQARNTFYFGSELFVAPLTSPRDPITRRSMVRAWVPPGRHVDVFSGAVYDGDRTIEFHRAIDEYVVLAKEGSIIPVDGAEVPQNNCTNPTSMAVLVVVGADAEFEMYEDDGTGTSLEEAKIFTTIMSYDHLNGTLTIKPRENVNPEDYGVPLNRTWRITFISAEASISTILVDGEQYTDTQTNTSQSQSPSPSKSKNPNTTTLLQEIPTKSTLKITLSQKTPSLKIHNPLQFIFPIVDEAQTHFELKKELWNILESEVHGKGTKAGMVLALMGKGEGGLSEGLGKAVLEGLLGDCRG